MARAAEELDRLADALLAAGRQGQKVLAIGGCRRGEGATTLLLCAVRRLAERGIKPVLVDADLGRPRLAKRLGVQPQFGWDETTEAGGPIARSGDCRGDRQQRGVVARPRAAGRVRPARRAIRRDCPPA